MIDQSTGTEIPPMMISQHGAGSIRVVVVGAGGTGGRLIGPLMQVMRAGIDTVAVVDGDHVEDRNLARQNFRLRDIGENKAEVMVRRYQREGVEATAFGAMLTLSNWGEITRAARPTSKFIFLGCVDNTAARLLIQRLHRSVVSLWIDGGNEMRGGQVILNANTWPFLVKGMAGTVFYEQSSQYKLDGFKAMPQLLVPRADEATEASCRDRIDLQTVAVNQLSATSMLNVLSCVLYGIPITTCGAFFSTLNTMSSIKLKSVRWEYSEVEPETTYASAGTD